MFHPNSLLIGLTKEHRVTFTHITARSQPVPPPSLLQVLILDDERFDRHRLARLCSGLDMACEVANAVTLSEFEDLIEQHRFDLILIDYGLPDGTGMEALHMINMSAQNHTAATIMITGQDKEALAQQAIDSGCRDYLSKDDLSAPEFSRAVANALRKSKLTPALNAQTYPRADVVAIVEHLAAKSAQDIKPMVSRMMRQVRDLRARSGSDLGDAPAPTGAIEDSCVNIWEFLVALERSSGEAIIAQTILEEGTPQSRSAPKTAIKPPSPFSKVRG
jgi:DNA-binding NarL/FixJ family response regulator